MSNAFEAVIGHTTQKEYLNRVIENKSLSHAYCFSGPDSLGKMTCAIALSKSILETDHAEAQLNSQVIERLFDAKTGVQKESISVEQMRDLRTKLSLSSFDGGKKIAIINDADTMTVAAQNALLKTLEEPKGDVILILIASDPSRLLPTILSRVVHLRFSRVARASILEALKTKGVEQKNADIFSREANGCPGIALSRLKEDAPETQPIDSILSFLTLNNAKRLMEAEKISKASQNRAEVEQFFLGSRVVLHDMLALFFNAKEVPVYVDHAFQLTALAQEYGSARCVQGLKAINDCLDQLHQNGNVTLSLEHFAVSL